MTIPAGVEPASTGRQPAILPLNDGTIPTTHPTTKRQTNRQSGAGPGVEPGLVGSKPTVVPSDSPAIARRPRRAPEKRKRRQVAESKGLEPPPRGRPHQTRWAPRCSAARAPTPVAVSVAPQRRRPTLALRWERAGLRETLQGWCGRLPLPAPPGSTPHSLRLRIACQPEPFRRIARIAHTAPAGPQGDRAVASRQGHGVKGLVAKGGGHGGVVANNASCHWLTCECE